MKLLAALAVLILSTTVQATQLEGSTNFFENKILSETNTLSKGQYEIFGGFDFTGGSSSTYSATAGTGYFFKDDLAAIGSLALEKDTDTTTTTLTGGAQYYFSKTETFAPFVSQLVEIKYQNDAEFGGATNLGVLFMVAPRVGFKTMGRLRYNLDAISASTFSVIGQFTIFLK